MRKQAAGVSLHPWHEKKWKKCSLQNENKLKAPYMRQKPCGKKGTVFPSMCTLACESPVTLLSWKLFFFYCCSMSFGFQYDSKNRYTYLLFGQYLTLNWKTKHKFGKWSSFLSIFTSYCVIERKQQLFLSQWYKAQGHRPPALPTVPHTEVMVHVCAWPVKLPLRTSGGPSAWYPSLTPAVKTVL